MPTKLSANALWLLQFLAQRPSGFYVGRSLPCDAPAGISMATMAGLKRRGLVEERMVSIYHITVAGQDALAQNKETK